jgi:hypothetical protein
MNDTDRSSVIRRFFGVVAQPRTYGNVAYVWLGFPLGLLYFIVLVTGGALSIGLSLFWIGLVVMLGVMLSIWSLVLFERILSEWLLGEPFPVQSWAPRSEPVKEWLRSIVKNPATWRGGLFLFLKFPIGLACWIVSVVSFSVSAAMILAPFDNGDFDIDLWFVQDPTGGWLLSILGIVLLFVTLHLHNGMGALWKIMARHLLSMPSDKPAEPGDFAPPAPPLSQELQPA